jgi:hypothetical protein
MRANIPLSCDRPVRDRRFKNRRNEEQPAGIAVDAQQPAARHHARGAKSRSF